MNNQEIFDVVSSGMLGTMKKGETIRNDFRCQQECFAYIGDDGNRCGLGLLIPPHITIPRELNTKHILQSSIIEFFVHHGIITKEQSYLCSQTMCLLVKLQTLHDNYEIEGWYGGLFRIAQEFSFNPPQHITPSVDTLVKCSHE